MASTSGLVLAGYYLANENIKDLRYVQLSECLLYSGKGIKALQSVHQNIILVGFKCVFIVENISLTVTRNVVSE